MPLIVFTKKTKKEEKKRELCYLDPTLCCSCVEWILWTCLLYMKFRFTMFLITSILWCHFKKKREHILTRVGQLKLVYASINVRIYYYYYFFFLTRVRIYVKYESDGDLIILYIYTYWYLRNGRAMLHGEWFDHIY